MSSFRNIGRYQPAPRPISSVSLSSAMMDMAALNARLLYDDCRSWPAPAFYSHAGGFGYAGASTYGVLGIQYTKDESEPVAVADIYKRPGAGCDTLYVRGAYLGFTGGSHRIDVRINGVLAQSFAANATTVTAFNLSYNIGPGNTYGVTDGETYNVVVYATDLTGVTVPLVVWVDAIYGEAATVGLGSLPTLPTFAGAGTISTSDYAAVLDRMDLIANRISNAVIPGFSGTMEGAFTHATVPDMTNVSIRLLHYACPILPGRRLLRVHGRHESRMPAAYNLRWAVNGTILTPSATFTTPHLQEPWEETRDLSSLGLSDGSIARIGLDYTPQGPRLFPAPRYALLDWLVGGQDSSALYAELPPLAVQAQTAAAVLAYLQQLRNNVQAATEVYNRAAIIWERDWPWVSQWDTSRRHMFRPLPGAADDIKRRDKNRTNGVACFRRWGDELLIKAVKPRIVWGPRLYQYEDERLATGAQIASPPSPEQEKLTLEQPYEYVIDDDPNKATFIRLSLGSVTSNGASIDFGDRFDVVADRIVFVGQKRLGPQV